MNKKLILSTMLGILINPAMSMNAIDNNSINNINIDNINVKNNINLNNANIIEKEFESFEVKIKNYSETIDKIKTLMEEAEKKITSKAEIKKSIKNHIQNNAKVQEKLNEKNIKQITNDININILSTNAVNNNNAGCIISENFMNKIEEICKGDKKEIEKYYKYYNLTVQGYVKKLIKSQGSFKHVKIEFLDSKNNKITNGYFRDVNKVIFNTDFFAINNYRLFRKPFTSYFIVRETRNECIYIYKMLKETKLKEVELIKSYPNEFSVKINTNKFLAKLKEVELIKSYPNEFLVEINLDWTNVSLYRRTKALKNLNKAQEYVEEFINELQQNSENEEYNKYVNCPINFNLNVRLGEDKEKTVNLLNKNKIQELINVLKDECKDADVKVLKEALKEALKAYILGSESYIDNYKINFFKTDSSDKYIECNEEDLLKDTDISKIECIDDFSNESKFIYKNHLNILFIQKIRNFPVSCYKQLGLSTPKEYLMKFNLNYENFLLDNKKINNKKIEEVLDILNNVLNDTEANCSELNQKETDDKYVNYPIKIELNFIDRDNENHKFDLLSKEEIKELINKIENFKKV